MDAREGFEQFLFHEARLLDDRRFRDWMNLFTEDGTYWVPAVPEQDSPFDQASLFYDDRDLMQTRIARLEHPRIHVQTPPSRTAHLVGNVVVEQDDGEAASIGSLRPSSWWNTATTNSASLPAANPSSAPRRRNFRIVQKRVDLINCDAAFEAIAVPI